MFVCQPTGVKFTLRWSAEHPPPPPQKKKKHPKNEEKKGKHTHPKQQQHCSVFVCESTGIKFIRRWSAKSTHSTVFVCQSFCVSICRVRVLPATWQGRLDVMRKFIITATTYFCDGMLWLWNRLCVFVTEFTSFVASLLPASTTAIRQ